MSTPRGVFITGTDTGVGKTLVATAILRGLAAGGLRVAGMKPVASGSQRRPEGLRNADALALSSAANITAPYETINPYCFEPAIAPHIAARDAGVAIDIHRVRGLFQALAREADFVVVEGAGGWLTPISATQTLADLALALEIPVILVVGLRLGAVNHALLSRESLASCGARLAGWVASHIDAAFERSSENLATLEARLHGAPLGSVPFLTHPGRGWSFPEAELPRLREALQLTPPR